MLDENSLSEASETHGELSNSSTTDISGKQCIERNSIETILHYTKMVFYGVSLGFLFYWICLWFSFFLSRWRKSCKFVSAGRPRSERAPSTNLWWTASSRLRTYRQRLRARTSCRITTWSSPSSTPAARARRQCSWPTNWHLLISSCFTSTAPLPWTSSSLSSRTTLSSTTVRSTSRWFTGSARRSRNSAPTGVSSSVSASSSRRICWITAQPLFDFLYLCG